MGYETKLYIGYVMPILNRPLQTLTLLEDFHGIPRGSSFVVYPHNDVSPTGFYMPDGNTLISLSEMEGIAEIHAERKFQHYFNIAMIDMCKIGHISSYLKESDILCQDVIFQEIGYGVTLKDMYGDKIVVYKAKSVLRALRKMARDGEGDKYWRWKLVTHALSRIINDAWQPNIGVICYGY